MVRGADVTLYLSLNQSGPADTEEQRVRAAAEKASCIGVAPRQAENSRCFLTRLEAFLLWYHCLELLARIAMMKMWRERRSSDGLLH
jgi:hypothetical protein